VWHIFHAKLFGWSKRFQYRLAASDPINWQTRRQLNNNWPRIWKWTKIIPAQCTIKYNANFIQPRNTWHMGHIMKCSQRNYFVHPRYWDTFKNALWRTLSIYSIKSRVAKIPSALFHANENAWESSELKMIREKAFSAPDSRARVVAVTFFQNTCPQILTHLAFKD
jgi:hypothetical protein